MAPHLRGHLLYIFIYMASGKYPIFNRSKNPFNKNDYKIKSASNNKYLYYEKETNTIKLEENKYNYFSIKENKDKKEILYGIYPITRYNIPKNFINDLLYAKCMLDKKEKEIELKEVEESGALKYLICLKKHNLYLKVENGEVIFKDLITNKNKNKIEINEEKEKEYIWIIDNEDSKREEIEVERIIKKEENMQEMEIIYKDIELGIEITNPYYGWKLETIIKNK
jgi:transcriptional antiterminator Rof (Rho-off)